MTGSMAVQDAVHVFQNDRLDVLTESDLVSDSEQTMPDIAQVRL